MRFLFDLLSLDYNRPAVVSSSVARLCAAWRTVALDTLELWTCISATSALEFQKAQLRMSGALPLRLYQLDRCTLEFDQEIREVNKFIDLMRLHLHRCTSAQLVLTRADVFIPHHDVSRPSRARPS